MAEAWIFEFFDEARNRANSRIAAAGLGDGDGIGSKLTPTATAKTVTLSAQCLSVTVESVDTAIRFDIGAGVTAATDSPALLVGASKSFDLPHPRSEAWVLSYIAK